MANTPLKILVVDDEPGICSGVIRILQNFKVSYPFMEEDITFTIDEAGTGREAIAKIDNLKPDIALLDNKLPDIEGVEVLDYIKKQQLDIIVVMITSFASLELAVKATKNGAYDFIPKPFTSQDLRSSIENISKHIFLKRMTARLNESAKHIRFQFLSVLSHELKTPLNAIEGYLNMMSEQQFGDNISSYKEIIERSLLRLKGMRGLIMDMLDLTKVESGKPTQKIIELDLTTIAQRAIDTIKPIAIQKDVDVYLNTKEQFIINADEEDIEIIFNNLLSNAVKYNKKGGRVDCYIQKEANNIKITVSDTGIGMTEEEMQHLFKDFSRIKNPKTKNITGSGLGLSIVKKITELYKGNVSVKSIPEKGTTFSVILPV